jgi:predicted outer membrane repeat protein
MKGTLLLAICLVLFDAITTVGQTRYYVNQSVSESGDGRSWATAFKHPQEAIDAASELVADEIWVAKGTYYPTKDPYGDSDPSDEGWKTFFLGKHLKLYGGFAGDETKLSQRNPSVNTTLLSGNLGIAADSTDNAYHIILAVGSEESPLTNQLVIDGFTIAEGYAYYQGTFAVNGQTVYNYNGGGIYNIYASPVLNNLVITDNNGFVGGGIHNQRSSPVISNCIITANGYIRSANAGGIYNNSESSPIISNTTISSNASANGGGIFNYNDSRPVLENVTISRNNAARGGGMGNDNAQPVLRNTTISDNVASIDGGGIDNSPNVTIELTNVKILNNKAQYGGGMNNSRTVLNFTGGEISGNEAAYYGGGMYSVGGDITISGVKVDANKANSYSGGGFYNQSEMTFRLNNLTVSNNYSKREGGGLYNYTSATILIDRVVFTANVSDNEGGGIYFGAVHESSAVSNSNFINNRAFAGGGIACVNGSPTMTNLLFEGNEAEDSGGGLSCSSWASSLMSKVTFQNNKANNGGGMIIVSTSLPTMTDVTFTGNSATTNGGAVYISADPQLNRVSFKANTATAGGAVYISWNARPVLTNILMTGNKASQSGGGIYIDRASPYLTNATIAGNFAGSWAGGIYAYGSPATSIRNTVIYGNNTGLDFVNGRPGFSNSMIQDFTGTTNGNVAAIDPLFTSPIDPALAPSTGGDYTLNPASPLVDKGNNSLYDAGMTPDLSHIKGDYLFNERFAGAAVDLGAYESGASALPVTLISFSASPQEQSVTLSWQTSSEHNSDRFEITRSTDGKTFETIGTVMSKGESSSNADYYFEDLSPLPTTAYYRLKMIDKDGTYAFSRLVAVETFPLADLAQVVLYPNPVQGNRLHIDTQAKLNARLTLTGTSGKIVHLPLQQDVEGKYSVDVSGLQAGNYLLEMQNEKSVWIKKLVIQH